MTITLTVKETQDYAARCETWSRERAVTYARVLVENPLWPVNPTQCISDANAATERWAKLTPFPQLIS
jgi:hypothetical protein